MAEEQRVIRKCQQQLKLRGFTADRGALQGMYTYVLETRASETEAVEALVAGLRSKERECELGGVMYHGVMHARDGASVAQCPVCRISAIVQSTAVLMRSVVSNLQFYLSARMQVSPFEDNPLDALAPQWNASVQSSLVAFMRPLDRSPSLPPSLPSLTLFPRLQCRPSW